ncbi:hypothetical protein PFUGPA_02908 [Plasmodium falciparum Palo Alto/Uganda]|uniref:Transcription elongation factor 1 homolog n=1 Tax=Plasmodium falciparum (isolate Palo Alto / Uganda) TaxID=57270 RepID=W4J0G1_PLAFP|nr:hypothetical protein PFUGPA_02908 [Plasmodium falciparum Palo Alto/Uganda]
MARSKVKKVKPRKKKPLKLDKQFNCPFCSYKKSVDIKLLKIFHLPYPAKIHKK